MGRSSRQSGRGYESVSSCVRLLVAVVVDAWPVDATRVDVRQDRGRADAPGGHLRREVSGGSQSSAPNVTRGPRGPPGAAVALPLTSNEDVCVRAWRQNTLRLCDRVGRGRCFSLARPHSSNLRSRRRPRIRWRTRRRQAGAPSAPTVRSNPAREGARTVWRYRARSLQEIAASRPR